MHIFGFEKLDVWQDARRFANLIYSQTASFPKSEIYGLSSQIQRSAISVCSNIAEGASRTGSNDQAHFYRIAYGSLMECLNQLIIACDLNYMEEDQLHVFRNETEKVANKLNKLRNTALARGGR